MTQASGLRHAGVAAIAIAAVPVNLALGVRWELAIFAGVAVLVFGERLLRLPARPAAAAEPALRAAYPLTRKELEVAILVAQGKSNRAIAAQLFNSERTIDNHVQHIYNKLSIDSRPELALWVQKRGLLPELDR
jgi:DNA-binding CsgD family transcriptional regulator